MRKINKIVLHCSASSFGNVDKIRSWHLERGWSDIGYHYVINNGYVNKRDSYQENVEDGFIEKGRPDSKSGAHVRGYNKDSIGICLIGIDEFSQLQFNSLETLLISLFEMYDLTPKDVYGHYEFSSKTCPNFDVKLIRDLLNQK